MKPFLRKLHQLLGLSVGIWAAVTALTGSLLVFDDEIDAWLNPALLRVAPQALPQDVDAAVASVRAAFADAPLGSLRLPRTAEEPFVFRISDESVRHVFVDPYTAEILGTRGEHAGIMGFLWDLHVHLLAGETGEQVAGYLALALIVMLISGLVLWWPSRRDPGKAFRIKWSSGGLPRMYDLHRVMGALAAPFILVVVVTGAMLVFHGITLGWLVGLFGGPTPTPAPQVTVASATTPVSAWIRAAQASLPEATPMSVTFAREPGRAAVVRLRHAANPHPNGRSFIAVNPYSAEVLQVHDWRSAGTGVRVSDYKYPLHIGDAFGLPGRLLVLFTGLLPVALLLTGGYVWWRKRRLRRERTRTGSRSTHIEAQRLAARRS
ncbi:MAG: PepSY domain-containing protein [Gammaproteobacteria bacterium]|nr:PepSY domain-containing protein [Gammaproteobacteria bacterium]MDX5375750.1 PepSY domain-containing protein [Gammaproteobacteria bacterium]